MRVRDIRVQARQAALDAIEEHKHFVATESNLDDYKDEDGNVMVFVGTVFSLTPSGKYYLPFACSNVDLCPRCKGKGCSYCGELGSKEAYEDEVWQETFDMILNAQGYFSCNGEGDPCDIFVGG
jgi:hypothetical protein